MLKKTIRRLGALAMVLAMAVSVFAVNASAVDATEPVAPPAVSKKLRKVQIPMSRMLALSLKLRQQVKLKPLAKIRV